MLINSPAGRVTIFLAPTVLTAESALLGLDDLRLIADLLDDFSAESASFPFEADLSLEVEPLAEELDFSGVL